MQHVYMYSTYFDKNKEHIIQTDASKTGLGAVLLQEGQPVVYASRALTDTKRRLNIDIITPSRSMQIMCIISSIVVMTLSAAMVIPGCGLNCDNKIAANTMVNPYSKFKLDFS